MEDIPMFIGRMASTATAVTAYCCTAPLAATHAADQWTGRMATPWVKTSAYELGGTCLAQVNTRRDHVTT
jgi:hypothetical protein